MVKNFILSNLPDYTINIDSAKKLESFMNAPGE